MIFWVTSCSLADSYQRFGETSSPQLYGGRVSSERLVNPLTDNTFRMQMSTI